MNKLVLTGLLAAGTMTHLQGAQPAGQRPNILFILSDDHTSQAWGIYGGVLAEYAHNANIRRLAKEGVVLDNCFCTNSISAPSRASILTGLYSHRNRLYTLADSLDTSIPTLATLLQANGYHTGLVGKWHIQSQPQGFDYYSIFYDQGEYRDPTFIESTDPWPGNHQFGERVLGFSTDLVTEKAIRWMKEQDGNQPFDLRQQRIVGLSALAGGRKRVLRVVLPAQRALLEDHVCSEVDALLPAVIQDAGLLRRAVEQAVVVLHGGQTDPFRRENLFRPPDLCQIVVGDPHTADLAAFDERDEPRRPALDIRRIVNPVHVDVIGPETRETAFAHCRHGVGGRQIGNLRCELGGDQHFVAPTFPRKRRENGLRGPHAVYHGRIPQVQPVFHCFVKYGTKFPLAGPVPKYLVAAGHAFAPRPGSEGDGRIVRIHCFAVL